MNKTKINPLLDQPCKDCDTGPKCPYLVNGNPEDCEIWKDWVKVYKQEKRKYISSE